MNEMKSWKTLKSRRQDTLDLSVLQHQIPLSLTMSLPLPKTLTALISAALFLSAQALGYVLLALLKQIQF